jgi:hypothetical protein
MEKRVRSMPGWLCEELRVPGMRSVDARLTACLSDSANSAEARAFAAGVLAIADRERYRQILLAELLSQNAFDRLLRIVLTIEEIGDCWFVGPLARILQYDADRERRRCAIHALGRLFCGGQAGRKAARTLCAVLDDKSEHYTIRAMAAESLACHSWRGSRASLLAAVWDVHPSVRFWGIFALGRIFSADSDDEVIAALESRLSDHAVLAGSGYWSISKEALAMLALIDRSRHIEACREIQRILAAPEASDEDRTWVDSYRGYLTTP